MESYASEDWSICESCASEEKVSLGVIVRVDRGESLSWSDCGEFCVRGDNPSWSSLTHVHTPTDTCTYAIYFRMPQISSNERAQ